MYGDCKLCLELLSMLLYFIHIYQGVAPSPGALCVCVCVQGCVSVCVNTDLFSFVKLSSPEATIHTTKLKHALLYANTFSLLPACWRGPKRYTNTYSGEGDTEGFFVNVVQSKER